jgi:hypothetical protein
VFELPVLQQGTLENRSGATNVHPATAFNPVSSNT